MEDVELRMAAALHEWLSANRPVTPQTLDAHVPEIAARHKLGEQEVRDVIRVWHWKSSRFRPSNEQ